MNSPDCLNTQTFLGQNATPIPIIQAVHQVLGLIDLDPASDAVINESINAAKFYSFDVDGFSFSSWMAGTVFLNPPGKSYTGGSYLDRYEYRGLELACKAGEVSQACLQKFRQDHGMKRVTASDWFNKLWVEFCKKHITSAIALVYRGGSLGSIPGDMLSMPMCITCSTPSVPRNSCINSSGRLSFEQLVEGKRIAQTSNTQNSVLICLSNSAEVQAKFAHHFSQFGVIKM